MSDILKNCRDQIDAIDEQILDLVNARAALAREIGALKGEGPIYRPEREAQVLRRLLDKNTGPLSAEAVTAIFRSVMSNCRALERELAVAFLGPLGTFSEEAANKQFGGLSSPKPCISIDEVFRMVESGAADYAVVPVENSTEGAVGRTLDLLTTTSLHICGEITLSVHHCLLRGKESSNEVQRVYSHAQSLGQCHEWLNLNLGHVERISTGSNAQAAELAARDPFGAAIASKRAAELFDMALVAENIEDDPKNTTRFLVLANHEVAPSGKDKTSLLLAAKNVPGAVVSLLAPLAKHGIDMSKFESRPSKLGIWEYVFFVDIEGHYQDPQLAKALYELEQCASLLKVLGSYPIAVI
ncbi:prephenate dehydratase [Methylobacillus caricis]|uniref:prephenate dehydratase n=1 Tax=Methylobacillus caricis TaxID=1971611 RepID=UPI001CFF6E0F|nr:prephenate dehydratase [Methylobacillus caricis]MCB5187238.1 prephenate dehydratase [Methylobacillus caricis]